VVIGGDPQEGLQKTQDKDEGRQEEDFFYFHGRICACLKKMEKW